jgi:serine/threonine protein kinase/Tol biopolymer transport system component
VTLAAGSRLGPYEVIAAIGAGGMGEVYKARDTRLDRTVAIKVLPEHLADSPDLRARFEREARAVSALSHPHICALYDVGSEGSVEYLVMEYLEGETLADRLTKGPLPVEQVLKFGVQMADALDRAHKQGITHRDLKPGNVMLTKSGVKLLDFGLAKTRALATDGEIKDLSSLPTEASPARPLTEQGTIMGTFQYMSPEQLEGREADARSDIFALGAVLYEMATGQKAFTGKSRLSLVSSILRDDPRPISSVAPMTPPALDRVVKTCLAKDPEDRFQTAHDVKLQLEWIAEAGSQAGAPAVVVSKRKNRERLAWIVAAVAIAAAAALWITRPSPPPEPGVDRFTIDPPAEAHFGLEHALSPDGRWIVFAGLAGARSQLYLRSLDALEPRAVPGTEDASFPFWSPDSRFVAFFQPGKLRKLDVASGAIQTICDAPQGRGGSWGSRGTIVAALDVLTGLSRVSAAGGTPVPITAPDRSKGETSDRFPEFLPDGRRFLFQSRTTGVEKTWVYVASLDSKTRTPLLQAASAPRYSPDGYLLFVREGNLLAQRFDASTAKLSGEAVPVGEKMNYLGGAVPDGYAAFSTARGGLMTYRSNSSLKLQMTWSDRSGKPLGTLGPESDVEEPELSHDGKRVAFEMTNPKAVQEGINLWIADVTRGTISRLTFGQNALAIGSTWSPDDSQIAFARQSSDGWNIYTIGSTGATPAKLVFEGHGGAWPDDWSPDGRELLFELEDPKTKEDLWVAPMTDGGKPRPYIQAPFNQAHARFSPDGRYVAYTSDESGQSEIYVQTYPKPTGKWQISNGGGDQAKWRRDGREIFFSTLDQKLMAADVSEAGGFSAGIPKLLFQTQMDVVNILTYRANYSVSDDGQRFLVSSRVQHENVAPINVVLNWPAALARR